ncbi:protocatechuate 3,4-dioxygenase [Candidatus Rariloculus sp.]|uniref:DODA-type extradiol aromatic ring-opening family dioxygenase n=1 Tax=Candidatus Rariloculus sp. TaxID=3101265 RepID=UPI003D0D0364
MAKIVLGLWTTHGPQLSTTPEEWMLRVPGDRARSHWFKGRRYPFDELVDLRRAENLAERSTLEARTRNHSACQAAIAEVARIWSDVSPDVAVIFGNDQRELVLPQLQPAYTVYYGDTFWNGPMPEWRSAKLPAGIREAEWANRPEVRTEYQGMPELAGKLLNRGLDERWDFAASNEWPEYPDHHHLGTPHAFAYVLRRVMEDRTIPTLPIITNTFFPPNQPRPWRCFELGKLVHSVIEDWDSDLRVAVVGSGGMSHFVINEEFDRGLIGAIQRRDENHLKAIDSNLMKDGTSELLNWVSASGCLFETDLQGDLIDYVPCYRSEAGSGTAQGFVAWR